MFLVLFYSGLLIAGMVASQIFDLSRIETIIISLTLIFLSYIMTEVGLEFDFDKKKLGSYGKDYLVAATAATFPWIFCTLYFLWIFHMGWKDALVLARFASPTSTGILFAMLAAAGLTSTWLFRKVRVLVIFDDLDTVLLMIPLKIMMEGFQVQSVVLILLIIFLFFAAYRWLHRLPLPTGRLWILLYGVLVFFGCKLLEHTVDVHQEVILPAFVLGCLLKPPHHDAHQEEASSPSWLDRAIKGSFMFLVGCSLPRIDLRDIGIGMAVGHVVVLTLLSNIGKMFPSFCYRGEATLRERLALSLSMFPRGEVGAGVLLLAIGYGLDSRVVTLAAMSLAVNLLLTGVFIAGVIWLLGGVGKEPRGGIEPLH